jgi:hypothetical protein
LPIPAEGIQTVGQLPFGSTEFSVVPESVVGGNPSRHVYVYFGENGRYETSDQATWVFHAHRRGEPLQLYVQTMCGDNQVVDRVDPKAALSETGFHIDVLPRGPAPTSFLPKHNPEGYAGSPIENILIGSVFIAGILAGRIKSMARRLQV